MISYLFVCLPLPMSCPIHKFLVSSCSLFCLANFFNICCKAGLVVLSSPSFCLSLKLLISLSNLNESLAGYSIFGCSFLPFITVTKPYHSLLACRVSAEKSADKVMGIPFYVICYFPLVAFNIFCFRFLQFD